MLPSWDMKQEHGLGFRVQGLGLKLHPKLLRAKLETPRSLSKSK